MRRSLPRDSHVPGAADAAVRCPPRRNCSITLPTLTWGSLLRPIRCVLVAICTTRNRTSRFSVRILWARACKVRQEMRASQRGDHDADAVDLVASRRAHQVVEDGVLLRRQVPVMKSATMLRFAPRPMSQATASASRTVVRDT